MDTFYQLFGSDADTITWWQMSARAALVMIYAVLLYRLAARRTFGRNTALDIVVAIVLGSTLSRALTANAALLPALAATAVLIGLHAILAALALRFGPFSRLTKGAPTKLIEDGRIDWDNARRASVGEGDLMEALRLHGVEDEGSVKAAYMERNGQISVIRNAR